MMDDQGKIVGERKHVSKKVVEKKLASIDKRINEIQCQKKLLYKNSVKVKKQVHCQINQIVKHLRARERNLLFDIDEAFIAQDSSIADELSHLLSTYADCQTLYTNIEDFKEHVDVISKINIILSTVNLNEKWTMKPVVLTSNFEQMKEESNNYGCLEGDFVKRNDQLDAQATTLMHKQGYSPAVYSEIHEDSVIHKRQQNSCFEIPSQCFQKSNCDALKNFQKKLTKRERTESSDSFEIIDILENNHCQEDTDSPMVEKESYAAKKIYLFKEESANTIPKDMENSNEVTKSAKFSAMEKHITEMQQRLENLVTSFHSSEETFDDTVQFEGLEIKPKFSKNENWLAKSPERKDPLDMVKGVKNICFPNAAPSPADLIKKAFTPYFADENVENWLSKNYKI